jgi:hypothetical protein
MDLAVGNFGDEMGSWGVGSLKVKDLICWIRAAQLEIRPLKT